MLIQGNKVPKFSGTFKIEFRVSTSLRSFTRVEEGREFTQAPSKESSENWIEEETILHWARVRWGQRGKDSGSPGRRTDWEEREEVGEGSMQGHRGRKERKGGARSHNGGRREKI
jgi:hypothetical protein